MAGGSPEDVRAHIASIATRSRSDTEQLTDVISVRLWPGGAHDRTEPGALAWVRRWRPSGPAPLPFLCSCAAGRCSVCN